MRQYDKELVQRIKDKQHLIDDNGLKITLKPVPDDEREHVLDGRVLEIAIRKKNHISTVKKTAGLSAERIRPDKICYEIADEEIIEQEKLIRINDHMIDCFFYRSPKAEDNCPVVIFFHGGGFTAGDHTLFEKQMRYLAQCSRAQVVFPEYRLAPENPYPKPVEDAFGTLCWVREHADELNVDRKRITLAGDSAGGSLVNSCLLLDQDGAVKKAIELYPGVDSTPFKDLHLFNWSYDMYPVIEEHKELAYGRISKIYKACQLTTEESLYIQGNARYDDPMVSIVYASDQRLKALPPMVTISSEYDYLRISDEYLARRMQKLGCDVKAYRYCGCDHGFLDNLGILPQAEEVIELIAAEMAR